MGYFKSFPVSATSSGNMSASASSGGGANARVTLSAPGATGDRRFITSASWSYSTTPSGGLFRVYSGTSSGALMSELEITAQGPGSITFDPLGAAQGKAVTVTLTQAGSSVIGLLNAYGYVD